MVDLRTVQEAAERIRPLVHTTPVLTSRLFDEACGTQCFFKCENFQRGGAFKIRGAANFLCSLTPEQRSNGVVAFSSGNHAQAVAIAAAHFGVRATIVMPDDAPKVKLEATRSYGASVVIYDRLREDREAIGSKIASESGAVLVPPYDHEWIIAGQGTAALELFQQVADLDTIVVCVGGGGLLSGSAIAAKGQLSKIRVVGVEPELANDTYLSLAAGERIRIPITETIADGLRATTPGSVTFPIVQSLVDDVLLVGEQEILDTVRFLGSRLKIVVEPSGAVSAAALLHKKMALRGERVGIIVSGGNV